MLIFAIVLIVLVVFAVGIYNGLVGKKNQVANVFASLDALLKKRYDLVPNLVATVQTYMKHEQKVLTEITELRSKAVSGNLTDDEKVKLDNAFSKAMGGIRVAVENYPDLKANQNFMQLQRSLNEIEEQISAGRRAFNASVTDYNNALEMFPSNLVANMLNYKPKTLFEISEGERGNVDVGKLFNK